MHLRGAEASVRVLLFGQPAHDAGGIAQAEIRQGGAGEEGQEHVGRHLHLQGVRLCVRHLGAFPVTGASCSRDGRRISHVLNTACPNLSPHLHTQGLLCRTRFG